MENNDGIVENESNNTLWNSEQQLEEVNEKILCHQNFSLNDQGSNQYTFILEHCEEVHIGPKIEYYNHLPITSEPTKIDKIYNSIFVKCKERLKNRYITNFQYMRSFFWDGKRNDLPIKDHFVELIVEESSLFGKKEGRKVNLEEIFSKKTEGHQRILISGESGYGKTTLCKKIAYDWATEGMSSNYLEHFDLVVVILLRELGDKSLYDLVLNNIFPNAEGEVKCKIENENLNILVMLDGFDEISNKSPVLKFIREESFDISLRMTIIVTSRPQATEDIREDMKSRFSVEGFTEPQQQKYIQLMFKDHEDKGKELFEILKVKESFSEIRKCPLMLHMICCLYRNDDWGLIEGITDLYIRIVSLLIKRYINKNGCSYNFRQGKYFLGEDLLLRLGKSNNIIFKDLKKLFPIEEEYNFIVGLGILELYSFSAYDENSLYHFVHFSFREFIEALAAYFYVPPLYIPDNVLLFVLGLSGEEPFPKKLQDYLKRRCIDYRAVFLYKPKFMLQAYKEIKMKTNWEELCSFCNLLFSYSDLDDIKDLLPLYDFTQVHFVFPENKSTYIKFREKLIDFYNNYNFSDKLVILLFGNMDKAVSMKIFPTLFSNDEEKLEDYVFDFREVMSCIIDFFNKIEPIKHKIYFSGMSQFKDLLYFFRNVGCSIELPEHIKQGLNADENEEFVDLQLVTASNTFVNYLISTEQYEILCNRIMIFPFSKTEYKCMIA